MKKLITTIAVLIASIFTLTSCDGLFGSNKIDLNLCTFDGYQLTKDDLLSNIEDYTFTTDNSIVCDVEDDGFIKTYSEGTAQITAKNKYDDSLDLFINVSVEKGLKVDFVDVGQGDAIIVSLPNGQVMMIDAGAGLYYDENLAWQHIKETLEKRSIGKIDYLVITHNHGDHYAFIPRIISNFKVENVYGSGSVRTTYEYLNIMQSIKNAGLKYNIVEVGDLLLSTDDLKIQVVGVQKDLNEEDGNPNYQSVMIKVTYKNVSYMFTGDAGHREGDCEDIALKSGINLEADVLKVGHHGSIYSSGEKFLEAVKPKIAIITTSKDTESGHPHKKAVQRLVNTGAIIYQTAITGTITVSTTGNKIYVYSEKGL